MKITTTRELLTSLTSSEEFCTLCLKEVDEEALDTEDQVCLNMKIPGSYSLADTLTECFVRYSVMIATMLHQEEEDCTVTRKICRNCAQSTITSYTFIEMCKESRKTLTNTVEMLTHCFFDDSFDKEKCAKSIHVAIDTTNNRLTKFYGKIGKENTNLKPLQTFKQIKSYNNKTAKEIKNFSQSDYDNDYIIDNDSSDAEETSCVKCSKTFCSKRIYKQHLARVHGPKVYQCKKCPKSYSKAHYLNDHMANSHVHVECKLCGRTFGGVYCLKRHMFTHKELKCPECGEEYESWMLYRQHVKSEHCTNPDEKINLPPHFICSICKNSFDEKKAFQEHMLSHTGEGKTHEAEVHDIHDNTELDENPSSEHTCLLCSKIFCNESSLRRHNKQVHSTLKKREQNKSHSLQKCDQENWVCHLCGKSFITKKYLQVHIFRHNDKKFKCDTCGKEFKNKLYYRRHVKTRHCVKAKLRKMYQERPACDICKKTFGCKSTLREHIRFEHENGRHFVCGWCDRRFPNPSTYKTHIVKHTRERNFTCQTCDGKFVTKAALTYHNRLHTGETPFKCDYCEMSFLSASRRMAHVRRKHMDPMYECRICGRKFIFRTSLDDHEKKHSNPQSKLYVANE